MKNTVKKILAVAFAVVMVCALMVPAFAAKYLGVEYTDKEIVVTVRVLNKSENYAKVTAFALSASKANVKSALSTAEGKTLIGSTTETLDAKFTATSGYVTKVTLGEGTTAKTIANGDYEAMGTDKWFVAVNGKVVNEALTGVAVEHGDVITVFYGDTTLDTKLVERDDSLIDKGIISFYYYDFDGNKQPLVGATLNVNDGNAKAVENKLNLGEDADKYTFVTDEKGQIWVDPSVLAASQSANVRLEVKNLKVDALEAYEGNDKKMEKLYTAAAALVAEPAYFEDALFGNVVLAKNTYDVAGNTGDATIAYVLVACAAVITLGAVVVMKKKAKAQ